MNSLIIDLAKKFKNFISIINNSVFVSVVAIENKNFNIPTISEIKQIYYNK